MHSRLIFIMKKLNVTEKQLANMINVDKSLINKWKNRKRHFSTATIHFDSVVDALTEIYTLPPPKTLGVTLKSLFRQILRIRAEIIFTGFLLP